MEKLRRYLEQGLVGLLAIVGTTVVTAVLKGESLSGLRSFWGVFASHSIPVWLFSVALLLAILGLTEAWRRQPHSEPLHIFWHESKSFWAMGGIGDRPAMQVLLEGTFTGTEENSIQVLAARLEGCKTEIDLMEPIVCPRDTTVDERVVIFVTPPPVKKGEPWTGKVLLRDQYNRVYESPKITLRSA